MNAQEWGKAHPAGTEMIYTPVWGDPAEDDVDVVIRSCAWALGHGAVVVKVDGKAGGVLVEHLRPRWNTETITVTREAMDAHMGDVLNVAGERSNFTLSNRDDGGVDVTLRWRNVR